MRNKVLFVGALPPPLHGFSKINNEMLELIKKENRVTIINTAATGRGIINEILNLLIIPFLTLYKIIKEKPQSLYLGLNGGMRQCGDIFIVLISMGFNLNIFIHHHSFSYINKIKLYNRIMFYISKNSTHIVLCETMASNLVKIYRINKENVIVLSNAAFLVKNERESKYYDRKIICIGFLSNITRAKGIFIFFDVMDKLVKEGVAFSAVIAGPLEKGIEKEFYNRLKAHNSVDYIGAIYGLEKKAFFKKVDLLLFPTIYENEAEPITIIESFSYSVPVISLDRGCIKSIINHTNGFILNEKNFVDNSVRIIKKSKENGSQINEISSNAYKTFLCLMESSRLVRNNVIDDICIGKIE